MYICTDFMITREFPSTKHSRPKYNVCLFLFVHRYSLQVQ
jgi:hypothetical protein